MWVCKIFSCIYLSKNTDKTNIMQNIMILNRFLLKYIYNVFFHVMQSRIFSIITPVFRVTWSFWNHTNMLISCWRHIVLLSMLKTVMLLNIFVKTFIYSQVHKYWDIDTILTFLALYTTTMDFKWNEQDVL